MKYIITQLVNQKQELKEKLAKTTPSTKTPTLSKPTNTKPLTPSSPTLKKPSSTNPKSNVKYISLSTPKEALTLKTLAFIKFNQIQIENIESKNFNTPTLRQGNIAQKKINEISTMELNTSTPRQEEIHINFPTPEPLPQTSFVTSEPLPNSPSVDSLLIKRKHLRISKHKVTTDIEKTLAFTFEKPSSTNPPEFKSIEKPKEVIKKTKLLNKNSKIFESLFNEKIDNNKPTNNNKSNNSQDIFDLKNIKYSTSIISSPQILVSNSQVIVPSSVSSSHPFLNIVSPTSHSLIIDSNAETQASNISEIFKLIPSPPLPLTPSLFPILTEEIINTNTNINSATL
jgi:hypothetical protein